MLNAKNGRLVIDDITMDYISFGSGKRTLIMLPGLGDGLKTVKGTALPFALMYRKLAKDFTVYIFSRKNKLPSYYPTREMAKDQKRAMEILGIEKADIVGVSQGGTIAQYLAIDYPGAVNKLVLAVTYAKASHSFRELMKKWIEMAKNKDYAGIMTDTAERSYSEARLKKYRLSYPVLTRAGKPKSFRRFMIMAAAAARHNAYGELEKITCPTLVIGGKQDNIVSGEASVEIAEVIPDCELYMYGEYGHALYEEAKDFWPRVTDFLKK